MSPADSAEEPTPLRMAFGEELEQLRLQVEVMGLLVEHNLERMAEVLATGDRELAAEALGADDEIDAMDVSLTERCYLVLGRQNPVATDLRLVVSVVRVTGGLERVGDLALRVVKAATDHARLDAHPEVLRPLVELAELARSRHQQALTAWSSWDLALATELTSPPERLAELETRLVGALVGGRGPDAVPLALQASAISRSLDRICDHAGVLGARVRYLVTGDPADLATEVR